MKLSVSIMAHPSREQWIPYLEDRLPGAEVVWDERNDRWHTGRRALLAHDPEATHHMVIQDDSILCNHLLPGCRKLIKHSGDRPVALYMGKTAPYYRRRALQAQEEGTPWFSAEGPRWGPGIIIPVAHIKALVDWGDKCLRTEAYDGKITHYYRKRKMGCLYTVPSLVNHRPVEENPSLVEGRYADRQAFVWEGTSAAAIDWSITPQLRDRKYVAGRILRQHSTGKTLEVA